MKRKLSLLIALILVLSSSTVVFGQSSDYASNWAKDEISYMVGKGIINGYPDGTFKPTNNMSKAEFYTVINGLVGYSEKAEVEYEDVNPGSWYYGEVQKASKANYLPTGKILNPEDKITRGEVARIIGNVFGIEEDVVSANKFVDGGKLPKEIKGIVGGLRKGGYIAGYPDGTFRHESEISRAEVVKMLHTVSGEIVNEASTINKDAKTNLVVSTKDVVLKDMVIEGNLYLTEGIGEGDVTLDNVEVKGELSIKGGGENSIIIKNSKINKVSIGKQQGRVRVVFENTTVNQVTTLREVKIELTNETKIETVELDGKVELAVGEGTAIDTLSSVSKEVNIESKGTIESIKTKEDVKVNGKVVKSGTEVKVDAGKTKEVKPKETPKQETTRPSSSGGWGGSSGQTPRPTPTVVSAINVDKTAITLAVGATETITATVEPENAANKDVTWSSSDEDVATVDENGKVTAIGAGQVIITVTTVDGEFTDTVQVAIGNVINITRNKGYQTIQEATEEIKDGDTLKLIADISTDEGITVDKNIIFDLNEKTITNSLDANKDGNENEIAIVVKSTVTVKNGTIITDKGSGGIQADGENADLILEDLTIDQNGLNTKKSYHSSAVLAANDAKITIISGDYSAETDGLIVKANGGTVIIYDGTFTAGRSAVRNDAWGNPYNSLTINGGIFNVAETLYNGYASYEKPYSLYSGGGNDFITIVNDGIFNGEVRSDYKDMIINGGTFTETIFQGGGHQDYYTIYGGTFIDDLSGTLPKNTTVIRAKNPNRGNEYGTLQEAITDAESGDTINILNDSTIVGTTASNKNLTFVGNSDKLKVTFPQTGYQTYYGCEFTFENLTLNFGDANYQGIQPDKLVVRKCVVNGKVFGYPKEMEFTDCVFNQNSSYNIWTYGSDVTFENCEFNSAGRSVLIYNEGATLNVPAEILFKNCNFKASTSVDKKAAIDIDTRFGSFNVEIENCSASGFSNETEDGGTVISEGFVHLKDTDKGELTVSIDKKLVYSMN